MARSLSTPLTGLENANQQRALSSYILLYIISINECFFIFKVLQVSLTGKNYCSTKVCNKFSFNLQLGILFFNI